MLRKVQVLLAAIACGALFGAAGIDAPAAGASAVCKSVPGFCDKQPPGDRTNDDDWI
ncbi:hypothetical protein ACFOWE_05735 [Planomonospora corallina]|uniref:Uncharacterized protein n=1 Tax=Planomonospora corallina TaxID=1806052 RepID=A0ABV8I137_9ACTN